MTDTDAAKDGDRNMTPSGWRVDPTALLTPEEIARVRARSDWRGTSSVISCWAWIFGTMAVFVLWPSIFVFLFGVMIVGGRQLGLAVLMHDAAHGALTENRRLNDFLGQWLCAVPVGADLFAYRRYHLKHHRHVQQPEDPDLSLSSPFPISRASLWRKVIRDLTGQTFFKQRFGQIRGSLMPADPSKSGGFAHALKRLGPFFATNLLLLLVLALLGHAYLFFILWLLPMATWNMLVTRIRNIAEHAVVPDNDDPLRNTRTTLADPLIRLVLAPYSVNYHVEHHMMMWVPHYNLPLLHRMLMDKGLGSAMEIQPDYWTVLKLAAPARGA